MHILYASDTLRRGLEARIFSVAAVVAAGRRKMHLRQVVLFFCQINSCVSWINAVSKEET